MIRPRTYTHPAKLMATAGRLFPTSHVVTSLVLFNWFSTRWALLSIGKNPGHILTLCGVLQLPVAECSARCRSMGFFSTPEAVEMATASRNFFYSKIRIFRYELAFR
jgi:hypothetical protein